MKTPEQNQEAKMDSYSIQMLKNTNTALDYLGYKTELQRAEYLAKHTGVEIRTALKWIRLKAFPREWELMFRAMTNRGIHFDWLIGHEGQAMTTDAHEFAFKWQSLPESDKEATKKMVVLLGNKDTEAEVSVLMKNFSLGVITKKKLYGDILNFYR